MIEEIKSKLDNYAKYHSNPTNCIIHTYSIPHIIWSTALLLSYIPLPIVTNASYLTYLLYSGYYYNIDKNVGNIMSIFIGIHFLFSKLFMLLVANNLQYSIYVFILSWGAQFAGHYFWEKKAPALLTSIVEAFTTAPLFCFQSLDKRHSINNKSRVIFNFLKNYIRNINHHYKPLVNRDISKIENKSEEINSDHENIIDEKNLLSENNKNEIEYINDPLSVDMNYENESLSSLTSDSETLLTDNYQDDKKNI